MRRRLLLERSAWQLARQTSVTEAGIDAGYGSTDAFTRAFQRAFAASPSRFPAEGDFRLPAPNGVHFHPPAGVVLPGLTSEDPMDLDRRLIYHDLWLTDRLLAAADALSEEELDCELRPGHQVLAFDGPEPSVRAMLERLVWTKEVWVAAMIGEEMPLRSGDSCTISELQDRFTVAGPASHPSSKTWRP